MENTSNYRGSQATHSSPISPLPESSVSVSSDGQTQNAIVSLSNSQELALEWLIGGGSITEAAQFAGVTRKTVSHWIHTDPDFRAVYEAWKQEASQMLEGRLIAAGESAMDNIISAVREKRDVRTSQFIVKTLLARRKQP